MEFTFNSNKKIKKIRVWPIKQWNNGTQFFSNIQKFRIVQIQMKKRIFFSLKNFLRYDLLGCGPWDIRTIEQRILFFKIRKLQSFTLKSQLKIHFFSLQTFSKSDKETSKFCPFVFCPFRSQNFKTWRTWMTYSDSPPSYWFTL